MTQNYSFPAPDVHYRCRTGWRFTSVVTALSVLLCGFLVWRVEKLVNRTDAANRQSAYLTILQEDPDGIILFTDAAGVIFEASPKAAAFFGCPTDAMEGANLAKYFSASWSELRPSISTLLARVKNPSRSLKRLSFRSTDLIVGCAHRHPAKTDVIVRAVSYDSDYGPQVLLAVILHPHPEAAH